MGRYDFLLNADKGQSGPSGIRPQQAAQAIAGRSPLPRGSDTSARADDNLDAVDISDTPDTQDAQTAKETQGTQESQETSVHARDRTDHTDHTDQTPLSHAPSSFLPSSPPLPPSTSALMPTVPPDTTDRTDTTRTSFIPDRPRAKVGPIERFVGTPTKTPMLPTTEARKHGTVEPRQAGMSARNVERAEKAPLFQFDASARADQKYTLAFTDQELEALEDVKLELRRRYDVRTTKTELVRCGLWELIEDYRRHGEQSRLLKRLRARSQPTHDSNRS